MNQLMYMYDVLRGCLTPIGEEIGPIPGVGEYRYFLKNPNVELAIVGDCNEKKTYQFISNEDFRLRDKDDRFRKLGGGIQFKKVETHSLGNVSVVISVTAHPFNGLPKFPLKLVTRANITNNLPGVTSSSVQVLSTRITALEGKQHVNAVYLVIKRNTLNCASENLSAFLSKDDAYEEALALTRADKDSKFLYEVQEVSIL